MLSSGEVCVLLGNTQLCSLSVLHDHTLLLLQQLLYKTMWMHVRERERERERERGGTDRPTDEKEAERWIGGKQIETLSDRGCVTVYSLEATQIRGLGNTQKGRSNSSYPQSHHHCTELQASGKNTTIGK